MAGIPDHVIEQIRERTDLAELVGRSVKLSKAGRRFVGLCPFHSEKSASFTVHPEKQFFHCFGCQAHGDVFAFRMRQEGIDFREAALGLAREAGISVPEERGGARPGLSEALRNLHTAAHEYFVEQLRSRDGEPARAYLERRSMPQDLVLRFGLGFAPSRWDGLLGELRRRGVRPEQAEQAGLIARRESASGHYDRFRARLIFPICDSAGRVVAFGGRALGESKPKYLNSIEHPLYRKGRVLFGLHLALPAIRRRERAVLVEGYFDVVALHRAGIEEAVAPCGTALTRDQIQLLRRHTREVVLLFDADAGGQSAAERALPMLLEEGMRVRAAVLPEGDDPDSLLARSGPGALRERVDGARPYVDQRIDEALGLSRGHAWEVADRVERIAPILNALSDPLERSAYVRSVASRLEVEPAAVEQALRKAAHRAAGPTRAARSASAPEHPSGHRTPAGAAPPLAAPDRAAPTPGPTPDSPAHEAGGARPLEPIVRTLLEALLSHPQLVEVLDTREPPFEPSWVADVRAQEVLTGTLEAIRERAERAPAWILGPQSPESLSAALAQLAATERFESAEQAREALSDCARELELRALRRESAHLRSRLESCTNGDQNDQLFEQLESLNRRRGQLDRQHRDERERTRIPSTSP